MNPARTALVAITLLTASMFVAAPASAQEQIWFGPFYYFDNDPERLYLYGGIREGSAQLLADNAERLSSATTLILGSPGGETVSGLAIAEMVRAHRLNTIVPADDYCAGSCFLIFMAGIERTIEGALYVGPIFDSYSEPYFDRQDMREIQARILADYGARPALQNLVLGLEGAESHLFTEAEIATYGLTRPRVVGEAQVPLSTVPPPLDLSTLPAVERIGEPITAVMGITNTGGEDETRLGATQWFSSVDPLRPFAVAATDVLSSDVILVVSFVPSASQGRSLAGGVVRIDIGLGNAATWVEVTDVVGPLAFNPDAPSEIQRIFSVQKRNDVEREQGEYRVIRFELEVPRAYATYAWETMANERFTTLSFNFFLEDGSDRTLLIPISAAARAVFDSMATTAAH